MTEGRTPAIRELPFRHNQKPGLGFEIFTLQELYDRAERHGYDLVSPQRPEFHTIYLGTRGRGTHVVDFTPAPLGAGVATVVARGRVQQFLVDRRLDAWLLLVEPAFLATAALAVLSPSLAEPGFALGDARDELLALADQLTLEGQTLEIHGGVAGDDVDNSYVWIPSIKTVVAGDIVFRGVHPWTANTRPEQRKAWIKSLDEITALHPTTVVAGHKDPKLDNSPAAIKQTRDYLETFDAAVASSKSSAEVQQKMKAKYSDLQLDVILQLGADAAFAK